MAASFRVFGFTLGRGPPGAGRRPRSRCSRPRRGSGASSSTAPPAWSAAAVLASTLLFLTFGRVAMSDMLLALWTTLAVALAARRRDLRTGVAGSIARGPRCRPRPRVPDQGPDRAPAAGARDRCPGRGARAASRCGRARSARGGCAFASADSPGSRSSTAASAWSRSSTSSCARTSSASRARPTTRAARPRTTSAPISPSAFPGRCFSRAPRSACRAASAPCWSGFSLMAVPLSLARGKIDYYLLPLAPALSLVVARFLVARDWNAADRRWARAAAAVFAAGILLVPVATRRVPLEWLAGAAAQIVLLVVSRGGRGRGRGGGARPAPGRVAGALGGGTAAVFGVLAAFFLPAFRGAQPNHAADRRTSSANDSTVPTRRSSCAAIRRACSATCCSTRASSPRALRPLGAGLVAAAASCSCSVPTRRNRCCRSCGRRRLPRAARDGAHPVRHRVRRRAGGAGPGRELRDRRPRRRDQAEEGPEARAPRWRGGRRLAHRGDGRPRRGVRCARRASRATRTFLGAAPAPASARPRRPSVRASAAGHAPGVRTRGPLRSRARPGTTIPPPDRELADGELVVARDPRPTTTRWRWPRGPVEDVGRMVPGGQGQEVVGREIRGVRGVPRRAR